jgi:hypothetical protein
MIYSYTLFIWKDPELYVAANSPDDGTDAETCSEFVV